VATSLELVKPVLSAEEAKELEVTKSSKWFFRRKCLVSKAVASDRGPIIIAVCCMKLIGFFGPPAIIFPRK
jgi:hypothetical protein